MPRRGSAENTGLDNAGVGNDGRIAGVDTAGLERHVYNVDLSPVQFGGGEASNILAVRKHGWGAVGCGRDGPWSPII